MPDIKTNKFRREAEECRRNAEQAMKPVDRDAWLRVADDWMKLARGEDLRIEIVALKRLRDFTATATAGSDVICPTGSRANSEFAAGRVFYRARRMYRPTLKTLQ